MRTPENISYASKVIIFYETLEYVDEINICYAALSIKL